MNVVSFPGLGLEFEVSKIAFNLFGIDIYSYAVFIVLGIIIALFLCKISEDNYYITFDCVTETMLFSILAGIVGARLYYVLFNLKYYFANPEQILNLRDGGLAIYGGLALGGIVAVQVCKKYRVDAKEFFDYIVPFVAIAQAIGRWGNFFNVEAYGYSTDFFLRMGINTENGYLQVHPIFLYESIADLIIFFILRYLQPDRKFKGQIMYTYLFLYSGVRMYLEGMRADSLRFLGIRISKVVSIVLFVISGIILLKESVNYALKQHRMKKR